MLEKVKISDCYNRIPNLKKSGIDVDFTEKQILDLSKCIDDIEHFLTFVWIFTLDSGFIKMKPWDFQIDLMKGAIDSRFLLILLARQMGKTTTIAVVLCYYAIFGGYSETDENGLILEEKSQKIAIVANKKGTAAKILKDVKAIYIRLPFWMQPGVVEWNKTNIELGNGSEIRVFASDPESLLGFSFNILYIDEFAFVDNAAEFWEHTYPVVSSGKDTKVFISSTPNGYNFYYNMYMDTITGNNEFTLFEAPWHCRPDRDEEWKKITEKQVGKRGFTEKYECKFIGASDMLVDGEFLREIETVDPLYEDFSKGIRIHERPEDGGVYVGVVDPAEGVGQDYSTFIIYRCLEEQSYPAFIIHSNELSEDEFASMIDKYGRIYNGCPVLVESNKGQWILSVLTNILDYPDIIWTGKDRGKTVAHLYDRAGLLMTHPIKINGCRNLKVLVESNYLTLNDSYIVNELSRFKRIGNSYAAPKPYHDDLSMNLVIFAWFYMTDRFQMMVEFDTKMSLYKRNMQNLGLASPQDELPPI